MRSSNKHLHTHLRALRALGLAASAKTQVGVFGANAFLQQTKRPQRFFSDQKAREDCARLCAAQLVDAVRYCHERLHAIGLLAVDDLRLASIEPPLVKLARFGVCAIGAANVDYACAAAAYAAPEQLAALADEQSDDDRAFAAFASDIWATGLICVELLGGRRLDEKWPRAGEALEALAALMDEGGRVTSTRAIACLQQQPRKTAAFWRLCLRVSSRLSRSPPTYIRTSK